MFKKNKEVRQAKTLLTIDQKFYIASKEPMGKLFAIYVKSIKYYEHLNCCDIVYHKNNSSKRLFCLKELTF